MSERGELKVPFDTSRNQARAADPAWSIWVSANAGSGKTYVLTQRVLRLLLSGVGPQAILCLTYTKAAAAEMRRRVAQVLGEWAVMDGALLDAELKKIEGANYPPALLERARTLFAKALETPGGLKIVTIHAFCESVLHRFPLEARVPYDFAVIEDDERSAMLLSARETIMAQGIGAEGAVETLFETLSDEQIRTSIDAALADGRKLKAVLADPERAKANLRRLVGPTPPLAELTAAITGQRLVGPGEITQLFTICPPKGGNRSFEDKLAALDPDHPSPDVWMRAFLTAEEAVPARFPVKAITNADPDLADILIAEAERLAALAEARRASALVARSEALLDIVSAVARQYENRKRARSLLDFDDLVEKLADLFQHESGEWVRYKLDAGIDHILVDESQDTNGEQWRVVQAIADEYFVGAGAVQRPRSLFAVGDQKQSIYSFQGAEPKLFGETGDAYKTKAASIDALFEPVPLRTSFRTLPEILAAVDLVSANPSIQSALLEAEPVHHDTARTMQGGSVTLWPPLQQAGDAPAGSEWPTTALETEQSAPRQVAARIASEIKAWIDTRRPLTGRGRAISADDVLILVQSRGALFQEILRALRLADLPTPGADRLKVTGHIAVMDMLALCDVLLNTADDLQLAALLRSPLFDVSEDDLLALAQPRPKGETLWQALAQCALPACAEAYQRLSGWRSTLDFERPFEFLSQVLYAEGGLKRFHARLGHEVDDVFAELLSLALDHEQGTQPSLQGFVSGMRQRQGTIKRELPEAGGGVRVMTVHGAKGLEAPIVILADAATKPRPQMVGKSVYVVAEAPGPLLIHASGQAGHLSSTLPLKQAVDDNILAEYWRRLYVGMTRAEDELYVTGTLTPGSDAGKQLAGSWYEAIETALRPLSESLLDAEGRETALVYPRQRVSPAAVTAQATSTAASIQPLMLAAVPAPAAPEVVTPSTAERHVAPLQALDTLAEQVREAEAARREGIALHAMLQHLGRVDPALWPAVVPKALLALLPDSPETHERIGDKAIAILTRPELAQFFGANSRAELPFMLKATRDGKDIVLTGRMDRLVIDAEGVVVIDYKSDALVPGGPGDVPGNYLTQLGLYALVAGQLYPGRTIRAAILWTRLESLMFLPSDTLAAATRGFTMR
ncbi:DNA helicase/exodeoxyribonuclease V, subunit A [Devosia sp. YR412]|uniref:double-strand break repair helicase AddA n=1 Tax=Devosia sp. YR412 TaxID=1881030 RepID=UPI0008C1DD26|nr:double-strand break repair helicase AddA [Devosia sp. YR412]SEP59906.1 DNA helicase/exodeoxyribonuclease V, subunit A [Devosia sp. YR412]